MTYDEWILHGPSENAGPIMEACETCAGIGRMHDTAGEFDCPDCDGTGEVETELDEPDGDYLYEEARDRKMEADHE